MRYMMECPNADHVRIASVTLCVDWYLGPVNKPQYRPWGFLLENETTTMAHEIVEAFHLS